MDYEKINVLKKGVCFLELEVRNPVDMQRSGNFTGSGFMIANLGMGRKLIATCAHVAPFSTHSVKIEFFNGFRANGKVVFSDHMHDITFIEFYDAEDVVQFVSYDYEYTVNPFEVLTLIGGNEGYKSFVSVGHVADTQISVYERNSLGIQTNLLTSGGSSGSPIFNEQGKLVGMHVASTEKCSFELNIEIIIDCLQRFLNNKDKRESGITFRHENKYRLLSTGFIEQKEIDIIFNQNSHVLVVQDVDPFYDSYNKLMPGDVIFEINGRKVLNSFDADRAINDSVDNMAHIVFKRNHITYRESVLLKLAKDENTLNAFFWENATFQNTNIKTRRYYSITEEGVLLSKYTLGSCFATLGCNSTNIAGGKAVLITHINGMRVKDIAEFQEQVQNLKKNAIGIHYLDYIYTVPHQFAIIEVSSKVGKIENILS